MRQDTGSAIVGPARADLYFGTGNDAGQVAERIRQDGRFTILLPREIDPTAAGARMPLPPVKALRSEPALQPAANLAGSGERGAGIAAVVKHENARREPVSSTRDRRADLPQSP
jgi:hypothetical protein